jgi:hypothetical protein
MLAPSRRTRWLGLLWFHVYWLMLLLWYMIIGSITITTVQSLLSSLAGMHPSISQLWCAHYATAAQRRDSVVVQPSDLSTIDLNTIRPIWGTFGEHLGNIRRIFREHSWFTEHLGNIWGTTIDNLDKIAGTSTVDNSPRADRQLY